MNDVKMDGVKMDEAVWKHGTGLWTSEAKTEDGKPVHEFNCEFLQLCNSKNVSNSVVMKYQKLDENQKPIGDSNYVVTEASQLSRIHLSELDANEIRSQWRNEIMGIIGSVGKSTIVCLVSARFVEYNKIMGLRTRSNVLWPDGVTNIMFAKGPYSKDELQAVGVTSKLMNELLARGMAVIVKK